MKVIRAAFPLGVVDQDVLNELAGLAVGVERNETAMTTAGPSSNNLASGGGGGSSGSGTSGGMIAGIVVGCLALVGLVAVGVFLCLGYRKEGKEEKLKRKIEAETGEILLIHSASVGRGTCGQKSKEDIMEFPAGAMIELPSPVPYPRLPGRFAEMAADTGAVELPTDYNAVA